MADDYNVYRLKLDQVTNESLCEIQLDLEQTIAGASYSINAAGDFSLDVGPGPDFGVVAQLPAGDQKMRVHVAVASSAGNISGTLSADPVLPIDLILLVLGGGTIATLPAGEATVSFTQAILVDWTSFTEEEVVKYFRSTTFESAA